MSSFRSERPRAAAAPATKTADCPAVADLIDYAEGRAGSEDLQRIQEHLGRGACPHCRGWIEKARPPASPPLSFPPPPIAAARSAAPSGSGALANVTWQRQALDSLTERLNKLEET